MTVTKLVAPFVFGATILRLRDVDTVVLQVDRGWDDLSKRVFRLHGCNGREEKDPGGDWCAAQLEAEMYPGRRVLVTSLKPGTDFPADKYGGRWVAKITTEGGNLTDLLIKAGLAAKWNGRLRKPLPPWPIPDGTPTLAELMPRPA